MSDEEFEDEAELDLDDDEIADEDDLIADEDDDLVDDLLVDEVDDELDVSPEIPVPVITDDTATEVVEVAEEDDDVVDLDEELHPDDVEEPLDVLLQERTASATLEDDEEEVEDDDDPSAEGSDGPTRIVPRRPGEFLCSSCFLVLPRNQLADEARMLCRDCA
jgi:Domain of unknown function (DUF4193)